jgi:hypothetical protein
VAICIVAAIAGCSPLVIPAKAGTSRKNKNQVPAFAGRTNVVQR